MSSSVPPAHGVGAYLRLLTYLKPLLHLFAISVLGFFLFAGTETLSIELVRMVIKIVETKATTAIDIFPTYVHTYTPWLVTQLQHAQPAVLLPVLFVLSFLVRGIGFFFGNYFLAMVANRLVHRLRCELFDKITTLPAKFFDDGNTGHIISRINYNTSQVIASATDALKVLLREGVSAIFLLAYIFWLNWKLSLTFLVIAPVIALLVNQVGKRFRRLSHKIQYAFGDVTQVITEVTSGMRVMRIFGGENYERERFAQSSQNTITHSLKMTLTASINTPLLQLIMSLGLGVILYLALQPTYLANVQPSDLVAYLAAVGMLPKTIRQLSEVNATIQKGIAGAESIFFILDLKSEQDNGKQVLDRVQGDIKIDNLRFRYNEDGEEVLKDISLHIKPGQTGALVGQSGSGKTTIANLIPRFYDYHEGKIAIDGVDIRDYTLENLREQIALVTQHVTLFNDTIANNIAYGKLAGTAHDKIIAAATAAHAMEFIAQYPDGLNTMIGENGLKLSGGQRQRLAIARALLKNAPILILDEATSALDTESENKIQQALDIAMQGRTTLVIAHRLTTIEKADIIFVMERGRIVEQGSHQELIALNGYYTRLHQAGFAEESAEAEQPDET